MERVAVVRAKIVERCNLILGKRIIEHVYNESQKMPQFEPIADTQTAHLTIERVFSVDGVSRALDFCICADSAVRIRCECWGHFDRSFLFQNSIHVDFQFAVHNSRAGVGDGHEIPFSFAKLEQLHSIQIGKHGFFTVGRNAVSGEIGSFEEYFQSVALII